jgi:hypothetical protein
MVVTKPKKVAWIFLHAGFVWWAPTRPDETTADLDVAPSLLELGAGWTTSSIVSLLDQDHHR